MLSSVETQNSNPDPVGDPDNDILPALIRQDQRAFSILVDRHISRLSAQAAQILGDVHQAEDVTQTVFLKTWEMLPNWETGNARLLTWMRRVSKNLCLDILRKKKPIYTDEVPDQSSDDLSAEQELTQAERNQWVRQSIQALPERQKVALTLFYYQELSQKACAEIMDLTVPAFESLLRRARQTLKLTTSQSGRLL